MDWSLCRYKPLVEGKAPDLLKALEALMERKRQVRTTHTYRVVRRYGGALRNNAEVQAFLRWMDAEGLACIHASHDPEHHPCRSTQQQGFIGSGDQGASPQRPGGGSQ